jgi:hypothetical protein
MGIGYYRIHIEVLETALVQITGYFQLRPPSGKIKETIQILDAKIPIEKNSTDTI